MRYLFLTLLLSNVVHATDIVTISPDKYSFNTVQVTAIMSSDIKTVESEPSDDETTNEEELSYQESEQ